MTVPPSAEPTLWELHRALEKLREDQRDGIVQLRDDLRADFAALTAALDRVVTKDVYAADQRTVQQRLGTLERDLAAAIAQREEDQARQAATRRWLVSALVVPMLLSVIELWLNAHGSSP